MSQLPAAQSPGEARRWRLAAIPHLQAGDPRIIDVPARHGIIAHKNYLATTACGQEMTTTAVTRHADRVRCPDCRAVINPERQVLTYKATSEHGHPKTGRVALTPAELTAEVQRWYDTGWQSLEVVAAGVIVAGIAPGPRAGTRTWWSETATYEPAETTEVSE